MIILAVKVRCRKEKVSEARTFFASFVPKARTELGCIQYDLFQMQKDQQEFFFFEKWADQSTFDVHSKQAYLLEFRQRFSELLEQPNRVEFLQIAP